MQRIVCAISGGVDSAVAALILKRKGYEVIGAFMKNWDLRDENGHCSVDEDRDYANRVCKVLDIPFKEVDFVKEYWNDVFQETIEQYEAGYTPNPDILCNSRIKFDAFIKYANENLQVDNIATGHYARTGKDTPREQYGGLVDYSHHNMPVKPGSLLKAVDVNKDQTFFLHRVSQSALRKTLFPVGGLLKSQVRSLAESNNLGFLCEKKESMGICFIGLRNFSKFLLDYIPPKTGNFLCLETEQLIGKHNGYFLYTLGQRTKVGGLKCPYCVAHKDIKSGDIYVVPGTKHPCLFSNALITQSPYWINGLPEKLREGTMFECEFRFMHREPLVKCTLYSLDDNIYLVILGCPLRSITPGQSAVFYDGISCLGGATITNTGPSLHECNTGELNLFSFRSDIDLWTEIYDKFGDKILPNNNFCQKLAWM